MSEMRIDTRVPEWDVADRLCKALRESGLTASGMAEYLDVHRNTIAGYLHGHHKPARSVLIVWALRTRVPVEWLLTGQSPSSSPSSTPLESSPAGETTHWYTENVVQLVSAIATLDDPLDDVA